jgi:short-subunit dehydrogenase
MLRKSILITGASSGLGEGMAREFAARGRNLVLCARRTERLNRLAEELKARHPESRILVKTLDVNDHDQVFRVFRESAADLGSVDRAIVNAGLGKGQALGTGYFYANKQTAETNFIAALAQCEAAVELFRKQNAGHLVTISSMSAMRGMPGSVTTYAATKAGLAALSEGIRADLLRTPIRVTTIFPGYIETEMNSKVKNKMFVVDVDAGSRALVRAIEKEPATACVPAWPWTAIGFLMRNLPLRVLARSR